MMRKWFHLFTGTLLALLVLTGCNNDADPPPPTGTNKKGEFTKAGQEELRSKV